MDKWIPSKSQQSGLISKTFELFNDGLAEMLNQLDCLNDFICEFLDVVKNHLSPESCHSIARQHKKDNPRSY